MARKFSVQVAKLGYFLRKHCDSQGCGSSGTSIKDRYPSTKQSRLENWELETKNCFLARRVERGVKKAVARASRRIWALASGVEARREETLGLERRREGGMMDWEVEGGVSSEESTSRDERPRCAVRCLASARMEGGIR